MKFFSSFCTAYIQGRLAFFSLSYWKSRRSHRPWLRFVDTKSVRFLFLHFSIICTFGHRRDCDKQKAVVVV